MPRARTDLRRLIVLGSTGSVGRQTLDVVAHLNALHERDEFPTRLDIVGLAAGHDGDRLGEQALRFGCRNLALAMPRNPAPGARTGPSAAEQLVREVDADLIVSAVVGFAGLEATLAALELGRDVALANKESLVAAGALATAAARRTGARILPIDSEHAGIWQCLAQDAAPPLDEPPGLRRVILTASGGPFRGWSREQAYHATPEQALAHPTWRMGGKISIDSASLMNKALELIEAHWLFSLPGEKLAAIIHPESIVHALIERHDGSTIAQLAMPDMRGPIQRALAHPFAPPSLIPSLDLARLGSLRFEEPDPDLFPALRLAHTVIARAGTSGAILNAANEAAIAAFLQGLIPFGRIVELASEALDTLPAQPLTALEHARAADALARKFVRDRCG